ncbi:tandem-95 repeat protein, partial [Gilvimarinus agarilyticus]|uniref:Ig-like domain-containing protein n=1 Tax=Gilvimarinus sp. 2_MG-2023 TaxID=3062666 RepID=UPI001C08624E
MSTQATDIVSLQGQAWAKSDNGALRELSVGDTIAGDEQLITQADTQIVLDFGDGSPVSLSGAHEVGMSPEMWPDTATQADAGSLPAAQFDAILASLEQNDELLQEQQFSDILATLDENDALLQDSRFEEMLAQLDANGGALQAQQVQDILASLDENDALLQDSRFDAMLAKLDENEGVLQVQQVQDILASLDANDGVLQDAQFDVILASLDANEAALQEHQFNDILASLDVNDELLQGNAFSSILAQLEQNGADLQNIQIQSILASLDANDSLLMESQFDDILTSLAQNERDLRPTDIDLILAEINQNDPILQDQSAQDALLNGEGDLLDLVQAPAAGGGVGGGGHDFVRVDRIQLQTEGQAYSFNPAANGPAAPLENPDVPNQPPVVENQSVITNEDTPVSGLVEASDLENDPLSYTVVSGPSNGTIELDPSTGSYTYTPIDNYNGEDTVEVEVSDGENTTIGTIDIEIVSVNDAPTADDQILTTPEDTPISSQVDATDVDLPDGDVLTYTLNQEPNNGSVSLDPATGEFVYTPNPDYFGTDQFTVTVTDSTGATDVAVIDLVVTPVNDAPVAIDDGPLATAANTVTTGNALDNDFDIDSSPILVQSYIVDGDDTVYGPGDTATMTGVGSFTLLENGEFSFTPLTGYSGEIPDVIYTVTDGELTDDAVISFDGIPGVGQPGGPVPPSASIELDADITADDIIDAAEASAVITLTGSTGGDVVEGDTVTLTINNTTYTGLVDSNGNFSIDVAGSDLAADGDTTIEASVTTSTGDVNGEATATDTENYSVDLSGPGISINDENGVELGEQSVEEASGLQVSGSATVSAVAGIDSISIAGQDITGASATSTVSISGAYGTLLITSYDSITGEISYTYTENSTAENHSSGDESIIDQFAISVTDSANNTVSNVLDILITDTAPTAVADARTVSEDDTGITGNVMTGINASADTLAADGGTITGVQAGTATAAIASGAGSVITGTYGDLTINGDGGYIYVTNSAAQALNDGDSETDTFSYTVTDSDGDSSTVTVTFTINGASEGVPTVTIPGDGTGVSGSDESVVEDSSLIGATFTVQAPDGLASVTIGSTTITLAELNNASSINVTVPGANGTLTVTDYNASTGVITYDYDPTGTSTDHSSGDVIESLSVTVTDILGVTNPSSPALDILITDTAPAAVADTRTVSEDDTGITGNVITGTNANTDTLGADATTVTGVSTGAASGELTGGVNSAIAGSFGTLTVSAAGQYEYVLNAAAQALDEGESETDTFSYTLKDSDGDYSTVTVTFTINGAE